MVMLRYLAHAKRNCTQLGVDRRLRRVHYVFMTNATDEKQPAETECPYCSTPIPNVDPTRPQFCSDGCKADYASEQAGYRSDREIFREESPYGSES